MTIERFSKDQFESALPVSKMDGARLWNNAGLVDGEYTYRMPVREGVIIMIRENGVAAPTGKDSIRCWLIRADGSPMGNKIQAYVTRVHGWQDRMSEILRELWKRALAAGDCPACGQPISIFQVKKDGKNKGRLFVKCWDCSDHETFRWLDAAAPKDHGKRKFEELVAAPEDQIIGILAGFKTKKGKVKWLRELLKVDTSSMLWALVRVFNWQTEDEKDCEQTHHLNKIGFSGVDAEILTSFAKQFISKKSLSPKQLILAHKKLHKYAAQLVKNLC